LAGVIHVITCAALQTSAICAETWCRHRIFTHPSGWESTKPQVFGPHGSAGLERRALRSAATPLALARVTARALRRQTDALLVSSREPVPFGGPGAWRT